MSSGRQTVKDLVEEAKKRVVLLLICVFGLSYLMSCTPPFLKFLVNFVIILFFFPQRFLGLKCLVISLEFGRF